MVARTPSPGDIYFLPPEIEQLGESAHGHPCLVTVTYIRESKALVMFMSSKLGLANESEDFFIYEQDEDFKATGLRYTSFIRKSNSKKGISEIEVDFADLNSKRYFGKLEGELKTRFEKWLGDSLG